jgi:site-specific DNA-methyltransferase (adenine-specific)
MGKSWDASGIAYDQRVWVQCLRVLKPGGHMLAFSGSRTYHRMVCAIEDAGFQIRDQIMWVYGSGFPKSLNISKAIDKAAGAEREVIGQKLHARKGVASAEERTTIGAGAFGEARMGDITAPATDGAKQWDGWGTALKPAHEPIVLARKPLDGTVANNVLTYGVGGINIDGCRVGRADGDDSSAGNRTATFGTQDTLSGGDGSGGWEQNEQGRFPANFIHDGSDEVLELFPSDKPNQSAARFFYCAKASKKDRNEGLDDFEEKNNKFGNQKNGEDLGNGSVNDKFTTQPQKNNHPTVKPTELMRYLCRLITPPNGTVLDPFTGSGSTGKAAVLEGFNFIGIEQSAEYVEIAKARIGATQ